MNNEKRKNDDLLGSKHGDPLGVRYGDVLGSRHGAQRDEEPPAQQQTFQFRSEEFEEFRVRPDRQNSSVRDKVTNHTLQQKKQQMMISPLNTNFQSILDKAQQLDRRYAFDESERLRSADEQESSSFSEKVLYTQPSVCFSYRDILADCKKYAYTYADKEFPPNQSSLGAIYQQINWLRYKDLVPQPHFTSDNFKPYGLRIAKFQNLYFLAAVAALCE